MTAKKNKPRESPSVKNLCTAIKKRMSELQAEIARAERQGKREILWVLLWEKQDLAKRFLDLMPEKTYQKKNKSLRSK